jgi:translocation and assembly module TamA
MGRYLKISTYAGAAALVFATSCTAALAAEPVDAPPAVDENRAIRFRVAIDAPRPFEKMLEEGLPLMRWQSSERVTIPLLERLLTEARETAREALAAEGYFSARVRSSIDSAADPVVARIEVELGPRTRVASVDIDVQGAAARDPEGRDRIETVRKNWGLVPGEPFRNAEWNEAKDSAVARLARGRYAAARIAESEARIVPEEEAAHLKLKLDSGPIFHAGRVNVSGLKRYPPSVVENLSPHERGEPYDATKLALYQRRLLETGYFNVVHFAIDPDPDQSAAAPLNITVIEAPSQRVDTGVSYSTDVGLGLKVDYGNADIFDTTWRFRSLFDVNQKEQRLNLTLDTPPRPGGTWNTYAFALERSDVEGLISREAVVSFAHNWGLERVPSRVFVSAHYEHQTIAGSTSENNHAVFLGYRKTFRTTEELISPREGFIGTLEAGVSVPALSSQEFARVRGILNWLIPVGARQDLFIRSELGAVIADSRFGIPSSFLFRTGGDQSVRGYAFESLGVRQGTAIVGGRYLAVGSVEYIRWITDALGAAVFVDAGDAFDELGAIDPAIGYGIGARWNSPIGPLRADIAYGERESKVRLHFSIGYSF